MSPNPLIGRAAEVDLLTALLDEVARGRGRVAVIEGEAGIGKTRLLGEALRVAEVRDFHVLRGTAQELERDRPFGVLASALAITGRSPDSERSGIANLLAHENVGAGLPVAQGPSERYRILESMLALVERLAAAKPLVLALEDLQWADPSTLLVVQHLSQRGAYLPLALLLTARPTPRDRELEALFQRLASEGATYLALGPLDAPGVGELLRDLLGAEPGPWLLQQVSGASGNPFFVIELVSALVEQQAVEVAGGRAESTARHVPASLRAAILRRLRLIDRDTVNVLRSATVLGSSFSLEDLSLVLGRPAPDLVPALEDARAAKLLEEADRQLVFRHDLVREAIYGELPIAVRAGLHAAAGRALAAAGRPAVQVATHMALGAAPGDAEAVRWLHRAARESASRAPSVAVDLLERAVEVAGPASARLDALRTDLVVSLVWSGRPTEAEGMARDLLVRHPQPAREGVLLNLLAEILIGQGRASEVARLTRPALAQEHLRGAGRSRLLAQVALAGLITGDLEGAQRAAEEGVSVGELERDPPGAALNLTNLALVARATGELDRAVELVSQADDRARPYRRTEPQLMHLSVVGARILIDADHLAEGEETLAEGLRLADDLGTSWRLPECHHLLAEFRFHTGEWDDAQAEAETVVTVSESLNSWAAAYAALGTAAVIATRRNALDAAAQALASADQLLKRSPTAHHLDWTTWARGLLLEARGDLGGSLAALNRAWDLSAALGGVAAHREYGPDLVRIALAAGDSDRAHAVAGAIEAVAQRLRLPGIQGAAWLCRSLISRDPEGLLRAVQAYRGSPRPVELADALEEAGVALGSVGRSGEAVPILQEAAQIHDRVGAFRDLARVEARLRSLGAPQGRRGRRRRPQTGWQSLTATERQVVHLVSEGLRNRQVAERLFISARTVQTHLTHIFQKLDLSSRGELIAETFRQQR